MTAAQKDARTDDSMNVDQMLEALGRVRDAALTIPAMHEVSGKLTELIDRILALKALAYEVLREKEGEAAARSWLH